MRRTQKRKSVAPVLIVILLILVISAVGALSFLINRYKPGTERMAGETYFQLQDESQVALVQNGEILGEQGILIGGEVYAAYDYVESQLNSCFYWDQESGAVLLTTPEGVKVLNPGDASICGTPGKQSAVQAGSDGTIYLSLDVVAQYTDMTYAYYGNPSRAVIRTEWKNGNQVTVTAEEAQIRYRGGIKSDILTDAEQGETLRLLDEMDNWSKVETADGYIGYIRREDISEPQPEPAHASNVAVEFPKLLRDHRINLIWHQSTSAEANAAMPAMTAEMTGVNVISPTWFSVTDGSGTISSLASADYVNQAHAAGREVWGLIDNFNENFDTAADLASFGVRTNIIRQLLDAAEACGMDGINVDFEHLMEAGIPHYMQFLRELTAAAHEKNLVVSVDTPVPQSFTAYYNRAEQARYVDYMIMMGYDEHYAGDDEAGSVSSLPFVEAGIQEMLSGIPKEQVICAIPFYTRVWVETFGQTAVTSEVLGMDGADRYVSEAGMTKNWDGSLGQNVAVSETASARYTIWMEDEQSIEAKMQMISGYDLGGVAEWKLGFQRSSVWAIIEKYMENR